MDWEQQIQSDKWCNYDADWNGSACQLVKDYIAIKKNWCNYLMNCIEKVKIDEDEKYNKKKKIECQRQKIFINSLWNQKLF